MDFSWLSLSGMVALKIRFSGSKCSGIIKISTHLSADSWIFWVKQERSANNMKRKRSWIRAVKTAFRKVFLQKQSRFISICSKGDTRQQKLRLCPDWRTKKLKKLSGKRKVFRTKGDFFSVYFCMFFWNSIKRLVMTSCNWYNKYTIQEAISL